MTTTTTKLLTKTWFVYTVALYTAVTVALKEFAVPTCLNTTGSNATTSAKGQPGFTGAVRTTTQSLAASTVFACLALVTFCIWCIVRYRTIYKQQWEKSLDGRSVVMESLFGPADREPPVSAEEMLCIGVMTLWTCLQRLCTFVGLFAYLTMQCTVPRHSTTAIFLLFSLLVETFVAIGFFYHAGKHENASEEVIV